MPSPAPQSRTIVFDASGDQTVAFDPYDPSLGALTSVGITLSGSASAGLAIESLEQAPSSVFISQLETIDVQLAGSTAFAPAAELTLDPTISTRLQAYDGAADDAGTSGARLAMTDAQTATFVLSSANSSLAAFTGSSPVTLDVSSRMALDLIGPANLDAQAQDGSSITVTLQYNYAGPASSVATPANGVVAARVPTILIFPGSVTTAAQTVDEAARTTGWSDDTRTVSQFSRALGTLEAVNVVLTTTASGQAALTSRGTADAPFSTSQTASVTLGVPGQPVSASAFLNDGGTLAAGASRTDALTATPVTNTVQLTDAADLAAFTGTGTYALPLSSAGGSTISGPNDLSAALTALAGATVTVSYTYLPPGAGLPAECFAAGTRIATPEGERAVETLRPGDLVRTASGRDAPVIWVGMRRESGARPVRVAAHAFADGVPARDLVLSPDHALFLEDVLIPVRRLIDGFFVARMQAADVTYFHVELDRHDVLLAEGLPAESYLDAGARPAFDGGAAVRTAPDFAARAWDALGCAPLAVTGPRVERVRALLAARTMAAAA